ncbi:MAG TPA: hypothetical protein DCQ06_10915 [Myxococcales bacterium]|nr:hypothetical protein [Myxococcales bacterium]HAN32098.1 hypothetical protein [Myxococcales bacterium]
MKRCLRTLTAILLVLPWMGFGAVDPANLNPTALGMAGVGVATSAGTAALLINPAGLAARKSHNLEVGVGRNPLTNDTTFFAQSVDGQAPGYVQAGVSYGYTKRNGPSGLRLSGHDVRSGGALSGRSDIANYMVGVSTRYLSLSGPGDNSEEVSGWGIDAGLTVAMAGKVRLGIVWRNAMTPDPQLAPGQIAAGLGLVFSRGMLAFDGSWGTEESGVTYRVGGALTVTQWLQLRAGYKYTELATPDRPDTALGHTVTGGLGVQIERFNLGAAAAIPLSRPDDWQLVVSLSYLLPTVSGR